VIRNRSALLVFPLQISLLNFVTGDWKKTLIKIQTEMISQRTTSVITQICKYRVLADACVDKQRPVFICLDTDIFVY